MNVALALAVRVQDTIDRLAAAKARTPAEIRREERLQERLAEVLAPLLDHVAAEAEANGLPSSDATAALLIGPTAKVEEQLLEVLADELGDEIAAALAHVEEVVAAAAAKAAPADRIRPYGMDRKLFDTVSRLGGRMLTRFTSRTMDALVAAADVAMPTESVRALLGEMLEGELTQLSRHAVGDVRNEATEVAERALGVTHHRWVTAGDENVREAHAIDGEIAEVGEPFSNGWRRPGGVGCRCHLEPVLTPPAAA